MRFYFLATLTIPNGTKPSNAHDLWLGRVEPSEVPERIVLYTEEGTFTGAITVQWSDDDTNFVAHYDSTRGANVTLPTATSIAIDPMQRYLRVNSASNEGAAREILAFGLSER
ncbi:hypothetical protein LCGC14_3081090 [marine sediment metagenome]|uniref:Uncharacterized protein n=1 Tax=marine sediment metagenome TaxID=412755 RepID=A0A0F8Z3Z4_9ZZZZ